jgi:hypothetical protein
MANKDLLTYNAKVTQVEQDYFAPVAAVAGTNTPVSTLYCFMSRVLPWTNDIDPPQPTQDQKSLKQIYKNIFAVKKINSSNISPVIQRIDWISGEIYDYYEDDVDMFATSPSGTLLKRFYIRNRFDQVYKCLWNNNNAESTDEPFFQPGNFGTNNIYKGTDGYKWKYMYTIDVGRKTTFMDSTWMPVPVVKTAPTPNDTAAGYGDVEVINVVNGGSGYDPANSAITLIIAGDGTGATGTVVTDGGVITDIVVTNPGTNYTFANVSVTSEAGSNATFFAPISPVGGHGYDSVSELGCSHVMVTAEFDGDEGGLIPTDIDFRQVGLLVNPTALSTYPNPANGQIYKTSTDFVVAPGFGVYTPDETVFQGGSVETATFTGTVLSFDTASNVLRLINTTGTQILNAPIFGNSSLTARTVLSVSTPDFITFSGFMTYIENRESVQRSADGIEQFKFVLGY